ncbi:MAG TPA: NlpC/P60 family protein [Gaiellaceae bacterium]|jgi:cell wall-associated NlpC family hydrolase
MTRYSRFLVSVLAVAIAVAVSAVHATAGSMSRAHKARIKREERRVVHVAREQLGVRYVWGGESRRGFDCSGLVRYVYRRIGISLPHSTFAQFYRGRAVARRRLRPGDLLFFDGRAHVGVYIGHGKLVHAPHSGTRVQVAGIGSLGSLSGARRLIR